MPTAERPPQLINPYGCEPDPVEEPSGSARVAGRALVIGTLGIGAAAALTGTGFAQDGGFDFGGSGLGLPDVTSYGPSSSDMSFNVASSDVSSTDSSFYGQGSGDTGSVGFNSVEQMPSEVPQQVVAMEPVSPVGPSWGSEVPEEAPVGQQPQPYQSLDVSGSGRSDSGEVAQVAGPVAPAEPLWGSDVPVQPVPVKPSPTLTLPEGTFPETYRDAFIKDFRVPEHPYGLDEDTGASFRGDPEVVAPLESSGGSVPGANWGGFNNSVPVPADSDGPPFDNTPGPAGTPDTSSTEPTGDPASPLIMATAIPPAALLYGSGDGGSDPGDVALLPVLDVPSELRPLGGELDNATTFDRLPAYRGDVGVSTPSFTDPSKLNWVDNLRVDTDRGSPTFGQVVPRSDYAGSVNDFQSQDVRSVSANFRSTPYRDFVRSDTTAAPPPALRSGSPNLDGASASGSNFGISNASLADTLQIRPGGPSSGGEFSRGGRSPLVGSRPLSAVQPERQSVLGPKMNWVARGDGAGIEVEGGLRGSGRIPVIGGYYTGGANLTLGALGTANGGRLDATPTGNVSVSTGPNGDGLGIDVSGKVIGSYGTRKTSAGGSVTIEPKYQIRNKDNSTITFSGGPTVSADGTSWGGGVRYKGGPWGAGLRYENSGGESKIILTGDYTGAESNTPRRGLTAPNIAMLTPPPPAVIDVVQIPRTTVASGRTPASELGGTTGWALQTTPSSSVARSGPVPSPVLSSSGPVASNDFGSTTFGISDLGAGFLSSSSLGSGFGF